MELYEEGYELKEDEYLLKIRKADISTGFMTKFNKNGTIPKAFNEWGMGGQYEKTLDGYEYIPYDDLPIYVIKEEFRSGWKLDDWRFGKSMNWASLIHPEGFTLEIYLQEFLNIVKENIINNGEIMGEFKWEYSKLIKS